MMSDRLKKVCKVRGKSATGAWKPSPLPNYVQLNLSTLFYKRNQICNSIPNLNLTKMSNNCLIPQINSPQLLVFELNHWFSKLQYFILHKTVKNSTTYHTAAHTCTFTQYIAKIQKCPPLPCFSLKVIFLHSLRQLKSVCNAGESPQLTSFIISIITVYRVMLYQRLKMINRETHSQSWDFSPLTKTLFIF